MRACSYIVIALASLALPGAAHSQQVRAGIALTVEVPVDVGSAAGIVPATYDCGDTELEVTYVNAEPNLLAIVPIEGKSVVFASAISASGARYTSGVYEWWSKGDGATLRDMTAEDNAEPLLICKARQ